MDELGGATYVVFGHARLLGDFCRRRGATTFVRERVVLISIIFSGSGALLSLLYHRTWRREALRVVVLLPVLCLFFFFSCAACRFEDMPK